MVDNILIYCKGGRGDIVNSEPAIRYLINEVFMSSEKIAITTEIFEPFEHLQSDQVTLYLNTFAKDNLHLFEGYNVLCAFEHPSRPVHGLNQPLMHGVDFSSAHLLGYLLPEEKRRVVLATPSSIEIKAMEEFFQQQNLDLKKTLLIHPGQTWETRTIPPEWWKIFIENYPYPVCIIGSNVNRYYDKGVVINGMLPLTGIPSLVDKLTDRGSIIAISQAWGLLSNDSYPVHIAGAFDNYLFTFATTKSWCSLKPYHHPLAFNLGKNIFTPDWYTAVSQTVHFNKYPEGVTSLLPYLMDPLMASDFIASFYDNV